MGAGGDAVRLVAGQGGGSTEGNHYPEVTQWRGVPGVFSLSPMGSHVGSVNLTHEGATGRFTPAFTGLSTYGGIPAACPWSPHLGRWIDPLILHGTQAPNRNILSTMLGIFLGIFMPTCQDAHAAHVQSNGSNN